MIIPADTTLCRIYDRRGDHPTRPDQLRSRGPSGKARFDHHDRNSAGKPYVHVGQRGHVTTAVGYFAVRPSPSPTPPATGRIDPGSPVVTAVAEAFQDDRVVTISDRQGLAILHTTVDYAVLDLSSTWATRAGAGSHLSTGPYPTTRRWARAIHGTYPNLMGMCWRSSVHPSGRSLVLNERAADTSGLVSMDLALNQRLDDAASLLAAAANVIAYDIV